MRGHRCRGLLKSNSRVKALHTIMSRHGWMASTLPGPFSLQRILGHANQETTSKYVNMARSNVKSQHSKYSPGERLG